MDDRKYPWRKRPWDKGDSTGWEVEHQPDRTYIPGLARLGW